MSITGFQDQNGFNLLHHAVLKNKFGKVKLLLDLVMQHEKLSQPEIILWVNAQESQDGFTPLHYASFNSNLDAIATLLRHGANKDVVSKFGLNVIHIAC